jgi:hypothetical protein
VGVSTLDVIGMYPVETGFWDRLDISASFGLSWDKGSNVGRYNLGLDVTYRNPEFITHAGLSTEVTTQENADSTTRSRIDGSHLIFMKNKRYRIYFGNLDHSDALGLDLRALLGAGYGWVPIRSQKNWFSFAYGADVNREIPLEGDEETNLEAVGMLTYEYFKYTDPEKSFKINLRVFPSITDWGRWRADFNTVFKLEIVNDLFWDLDFFANYDSDPITSEAESIDYGITSSIGYKF